MIGGDQGPQMVVVRFHALELGIGRMLVLSSTKSSRDVSREFR